MINAIFEKALRTIALSSASDEWSRLMATDALARAGRHIKCTICMEVVHVNQPSLMGQHVECRELVWHQRRV